jgi:hypothetical protein
MATVVQDSSPSASGAVGRGRAIAIAVACAAAVALLLVAGYFMGSHRGGTHEVTGPAVVGVNVVSMTTADGDVYGFRDSVPWIDANGAWHEGGWPGCLGSTTTLPSVTFGVTHVKYPDGSSAEQVVYVDCRS